MNFKFFFAVLLFSFLTIEIWDTKFPDWGMTTSWEWWVIFLPLNLVYFTIIRYLLEGYYKDKQREKFIDDVLNLKK